MESYSIFSVNVNSKIYIDFYWNNVRLKVNFCLNRSIRTQEAKEWKRKQDLHKIIKIFIIYKYGLR